MPWRTPRKEGNVAELRRLRVGEAGGEPVDATDSGGDTALHYAAYQGRLEAVQYMLQRGASVDVPNNIKYTALHWAARLGHAAVARELVLHGADPRLTDQIRTAGHPCRKRSNRAMGRRSGLRSRRGRRPGPPHRCATAAIAAIADLFSA